MELAWAWLGFGEVDQRLGLSSSAERMPARGATSQVVSMDSVLADPTIALETIAVVLVRPEIGEGLGLPTAAAQLPHRRIPSHGRAPG